MPIIQNLHIPMLELDKGNKLVKTSTTIVTLNSLTVTTSISGASGLDTGLIAASTFYYVYAVISGGLTKLIASTSAISPIGFTTYRKVGAFYTDGSSNIFYAYYYGELNQDVFTARVSGSGVISNLSKVGWITSCTVANPAVCTIVPSILGISQAMNCVVDGAESVNSDRFFNITGTPTTTSISVIQVLGSNNTQETLSKAFYITCQKAGIDAVKPDWSR